MKLTRSPQAHVLALLHLQSWTNQCKFSHDVTTLRRLNYGEVRRS